MPGGGITEGRRVKPANSGALRPTSAAGAFSTRTRRSYQAACPVIGSALAPGPPSPSGSISVIRWFSKKPRVNSGDSAARFHLHRPLGDRVQGEGAGREARLFEWRVPERQRVEIGLDPHPVLLRRHCGPVALRGEAEAL